MVNTQGSHVGAGIVEHPTADGDEIHQYAMPARGRHDTFDVEFLSIGQLPYLLTPPGHGFNWCQLREPDPEPGALQ